MSTKHGWKKLEETLRMIEQRHTRRHRSLSSRYSAGRERDCAHRNESEFIGGCDDFIDYGKVLVKESKGK